VVEILDLAYRKDSNIEVILGDDVGDQVGGHRQTIQNQSLDILKDVPSPQSVEYVEERSTIEAAIRLAHVA
jgi:hypothetical protein